MINFGDRNIFVSIVRICKRKIMGKVGKINVNIDSSPPFFKFVDTFSKWEFQTVSIMSKAFCVV